MVDPVYSLALVVTMISVPILSVLVQEGGRSRTSACVSLSSSALASGNLPASLLSMTSIIADVPTKY